MGEVKVWSHNVSLTFYRLTSLSFHFNGPSHSWDTTFSKFDLENPRSRSWLRVTKWLLHPIDSHPFRSMLIGPPVPEIQHFQNLTLKIQGQGHEWGESWKPQHGSNILSTHVPFIPCQSAIPFLTVRYFFKGQGHGWGESHKVGVTSYRLTSLSFHVNRPSHSWDTAFSKFDLENPRSRSWVRGKLKVTTWVHYSVSPIYRGRVYRGIGYIAVACWTPFFGAQERDIYREIAVTPWTQFVGDNFFAKSTHRDSLCSRFAGDNFSRNQLKPTCQCGLEHMLCDAQPR